MLPSQSSLINAGTDTRERERERGGERERESFRCKRDYIPCALHAVEMSRRHTICPQNESYGRILAVHGHAAELHPAWQDAAPSTPT